MIAHKKVIFKRLLIASFLMVQLLAVFVHAPNAAAVTYFTSRSVTVGSGQVSVVTTHVFRFTPVTAGTVGSLSFEYCDNSPLFDAPCNAPAGLNVLATSLTAQSGNIGFNFDAVHSTANKIVLTRAASAINLAASSYSFSNITNPSTPAHTEFVRLSSYVTTDASGSFTDFGGVAFATQNPFSVSTFVPPFLRLCVGVSVSADCTTVSGDRIDLGTLTPNNAKAGQSQFAGGTNSITGYNVFVLGTTMTSGNNALSSLSTPSGSSPGNNQFGINLRANSNPSVGQNPSGSGTSSPTLNYNIPNIFTFNDGDAVTTDSLPSDFNVMTVSYLVNVQKNQAPGVYSTTLTYLASADF